jgi:acetyl esterase/lipase
MIIAALKIGPAPISISADFPCANGKIPQTAQVIAALAKYLDWWSVQYVATMLPPANTRNPRLDETLKFLNGQDFIPVESRPAQLEFDSDGRRFRFPTPRPCEFPDNNVVHGRLYRCAKHWQNRPVVILLHGGGDFVNYRFRFPLIARRCNRAGINAAVLAAPYHFERRLRRRPASNDNPDSVQVAEGPAFPFPVSRVVQSRSHQQTAAAMAQGIADVRALIGWLLGEGCPAVALWGISLGGWLAAMTISRDTRPAAVVLTAPGVLFDFSFGETALLPGVRKAWQAQRTAWETLNRTALNVVSTRPAIPVNNILMIEGTHDLLVRKEAVEALWEAWDRPEIWRLPYGHAGICGGIVPGLTRRILSWLAPRLP